MGGPGQAFDRQLHQTLRGEADHLAQQIGIGVLFQWTLTLLDQISPVSREKFPDMDLKVPCSAA
jgi:hypothetical protein